MRYRVHVNVNVIRHNKKYGNSLPVCRVEDTQTGITTYCREVVMGSISRLAGHFLHPLPCGATVWIETNEVECFGVVPYSQIKETMTESVTAAKYHT